MATTGNVLTDILIIWVPVAIAVIMGLVGLLRGVRREAVVSLAIVLGALIVSVWGGSWANDIHAAFTNFGQQDTQTWLGVVVLVLVTLVIGYGLGSAIVARGPMSGMSRLGGFLVGLANGAALGGWLLRNYYNALLVDLSGSNNTTFTTLQDNPITYWLIIWAGWFPLVVALIAAIVALVGPFRRAQSAVATPSTETNWQPSTAPSVATSTPLPTSYAQQYPQYGQPSQPQYGQPYGQPYQPQFGAQPQSPVTPPSQPSSSSMYASGGYMAVPPTGSQAARVPEALPTMPIPTGDQTSSPASSPSSADTSQPSGSTSSSRSGGSSVPNTGPLGDLPGNSQAQSSTDSSWLATPKSEMSSQPTSSSSDNETIARSEAPTIAYPVTSGGSSSSPGALANCPRCGASVPADAAFCTECGNRLKS